MCALQLSGWPGAPGIRVKSRSLGKQVAEAVRHMILVGELLPGEIVTQEHLAGLLSVSTMPVREALLALAHEGLIEARPNRSFQVARTTRTDIEDIYRVHAFIGGELTARAARTANVSLIEELREVQRIWVKADRSQLADLNWRFHRAVHTAAESPKLSLILRNITRYIPQSFYTLVDGGPEFVERGHAELLDAIEARDPVRGREAAERNVLAAGRLLIDYFLERGYWASPQPAALLGSDRASGNASSS